MIDPKVRDIPQISDSLCGEEAPHLIVPAEDIPLWELLLNDLCPVVSREKSEVFVSDQLEFVVFPNPALNCVKVAF